MRGGVDSARPCGSVAEVIETADATDGRTVPVRGNLPQPEEHLVADVGVISAEIRAAQH
ncbi:hypothetical protein GCM10022255_042700 [Dactylosporangium darangshiense]|uniref:Uncharacterized protein n=1 Tax=Dactylosporangium darangshiense TaxID=579108 RepID=A0ABP8DAF1_9ACTN